MRIATWNINGIKARIDGLAAWLKDEAPDVVCLQEIKSIDENFPRQSIEDLGYNVVTHGQKGFNGVAILSKAPIEEWNSGLPGDATDEQARFLEAVIGTEGKIVRIVSAYMPNGNPVDSEKFSYKCGWNARLEEWVADRLILEDRLVLAGDYNIIPQPIDAKNPENWVGDALFLPESRSAYRRLTALGLTDAVRAVTDQSGIYTFWDYQAGAWQKNNGIRIDHLLLSPEAADDFIGAGIDKFVRAWEKPSDHVPVWIELSD